MLCGSKAAEFAANVISGNVIVNPEASCQLWSGV